MIKYIFPLLLVTATGCSIEKTTIKRTLRHQEELYKITGELVTEYQHHPRREVFLGINDSLPSIYHKFIGGKLKLSWVHIIYEEAKGFIDTDSVILFTRTGIPISGNEHDILVDFKTTPRNDFSSAGSYSIIRKIADRIFYIKAPMPAL